jgi:hypothetical protein
VIARVANGAFARLLENPDDAELRDVHLRHARWLRDNLVWNRDGVANWEFPMALDEYGVGSGWHSAMTNGFGLAVMFQAAALVLPDEGKSFVGAANGYSRASRHMLTTAGWPDLFWMAQYALRRSPTQRSLIAS